MRQDARQIAPNKEEQRTLQRVTKDQLRYAGSQDQRSALLIEQDKPNRIEQQMHEYGHEQERGQNEPKIGPPPIKEDAVKPAREKRRDRKTREICTCSQQIRPENIRERRTGPRLDRAKPGRAKRNGKKTQAEMDKRSLDGKHPGKQNRQRRKDAEQNEFSRAFN